MGKNKSTDVGRDGEQTNRWEGHLHRKEKKGKREKNRRNQETRNRENR